jgi:hypothetical protein
MGITDMLYLIPVHCIQGMETEWLNLSPPLAVLKSQPVVHNEVKNNQQQCGFNNNIENIKVCN